MFSTGTIGPAALLLAQRGWKFIWPSLALVAALLAGAAVLAMLERWRKRPASDGLSAGDQLSYFRDAYDKGIISKEEFDQIRADLAGKLRDELKLAPPPAAPGAPADRPPQLTAPEVGLVAPELPAPEAGPGPPEMTAPADEPRPPELPGPPPESPRPD